MAKTETKAKTVYVPPMASVDSCPNCGGKLVVKHSGGGFKDQTKFICTNTGCGYVSEWT